MTVKEKLEQAGSKILNWIGKTKNGKSGRFVPCHEVDIDSFIKNNLNGKAITLYLYIIKELSKDYLDFAHFTISGLAEKLNTSNKTIRQSLEDCVNSGLIFTFDLGNKGKLIFLSKESNLSIIEGIEKGVFKVENYIEQKVKIDNMLVRSCTSYWEVNDPATRKQMTQQLEPNSKSYWEVNDPAVQSESIEKTTNTSTSLEPIQEPLLRTSSLEEEASTPNLKTSSENLKQKSNNDDDDFLKNFDKEEEEKVNPIIEVLEEKNDKVGYSKQKALQTDKPDLTHTQKSSGVAGANCGQNVDKAKDELYKKILNIGVKEKEAKELIQIVKSQILEEYLLAVPYWKKAGNIKNMGAFFNTVVRNPKPEQLPKEFLLEKKQDEKKKEVNKFKEFCKNLGLAETLGMKELKSYISSCKNIFTNKDELAEKTFEQNFNSLVGALGSTEAEKIANQSVRTTLNKLDGNRRLLEKTLDYLKINTEITKFNYINLINKALNKIEIQFAGAI